MSAAERPACRRRHHPDHLARHPEDLASDDDLSRWVDIGIGYARSLPPTPASKKPKKQAADLRAAGRRASQGFRLAVALTHEAGDVGVRTTTGITRLPARCWYSS